jgi:hypothetical protein
VSFELTGDWDAAASAPLTAARVTQG